MDFLDKRWMFPDSTLTYPIVIFSSRDDSFRDSRAPWDKIDLMISTSTDAGSEFSSWFSIF